MGGGPASADVVRSSCLVTFPESTGEEPVPVDAWYLHAVGLPFLRRLARDRVGDAMRIALVLQQADPRVGGGGGKRYVAVSSQHILRKALEETFAQPDTVLVLHVVSLERVRGLKKIHVRPEINPNVSPEPVEPMALVFPALAVDGLMTPTAVVVLTAEPADASLAYEVMRQSAFSFRKSVDVTGGGKTLDEHAGPFIEERDYSWRSTAASSDRTDTSGSDGSFTDATQSSNASSTSSLGGQSQSSSGSLASVVPEATIVSAVPAKSVDSTGDEREDDAAIPMARVVAASEEPAATTAAAIPSDYVMLELQNGAGLPEVPAAASSTFFISSNWHVQADEMSSSMRLEPLPMDLSVSRSGSFHRQQERRARPGGSSLDESFVLLDRSQS